MSPLIHIAITLVASSAAHAHVPMTEAALGPRTRQYTDVKRFILELAERYPQAVRIVEVGISDSGETIFGLAVANPEDRQASLHNLVVATHHGNEYGATEVALAFAESLAQKPISGQVDYVIPVLNIAGYDARSRYERGADKRLHDPNRDYPGPCGTEGPFRLKSTRALADFVDRENIVASATLHTFYPAVVYPWGIAAVDLTTPYETEFKSLAQAATMESHYEVGNSTEVIYPAAGAYEDYAYWKHGAWSLLFELGGNHAPSDTDVAQAIAVNVPGLRRMMERAPRERAEKHDFTSRCDTSRLRFDRHDE